MKEWKQYLFNTMTFWQSLVIEDLFFQPFFLSCLLKAVSFFSQCVLVPLGQGNPLAYPSLSLSRAPIKHIELSGRHGMKGWQLGYEPWEWIWREASHALQRIQRGCSRLPEVPEDLLLSWEQRAKPQNLERVLATQSPVQLSQKLQGPTPYSPNQVGQAGAPILPSFLIAIVSFPGSGLSPAPLL